MGLYVEEFEIGATVVSRGKTIGEGDISLFAGLVGDYNPLHVDEEFCRTETPYGGRIAHGPLTMSVAIGLMSQLNLIDGTAIGLIEIGWTFSAPVKIGDTVRARVTPLLARPTRDPSRGVVKLGFDVLNQRGDVVQSGFITLMMKIRQEDMSQRPGKQHGSE